METGEIKKVTKKRELHIPGWLLFIFKLVDAFINKYRKIILIVGVSFIVAGVGYILLAHAVIDALNMEEMDIIGKFAVLVGGVLVSVTSDTGNKIYWLLLQGVLGATVLAIANFLYLLTPHKEVPSFVVALVLLIMVLGISWCWYIIESLVNLINQIPKGKQRIKEGIKIIVGFGSFIGILSGLLSNIKQFEVVLSLLK